MRIIAGAYRGRRLNMVDDKSIRPATDKVKGSIFNVLQNRLSLINASVLDLFAGCGSLAFEALSRGASTAALVDIGRGAIEVINENVQALKCENRCTVFHEDAIQFIGHSLDKYDLIFADPPYSFKGTSDIPRLVFEHQLLMKEGFLIIEHSKHSIFEESPLYKLSLTKEFGSTIVSFFIHHLELE